jgi:hypothetical protein
MKRPGYSVPQLRDISRFEVAPVVFPNLLTVAGEWAGFDEEGSSPRLPSGRTGGI